MQVSRNLGGKTEGRGVVDEEEDKDEEEEEEEEEVGRGVLPPPLPPSSPIPTPSPPPPAPFPAIRVWPMSGMDLSTISPRARGGRERAVHTLSLTV
jgi:hypothetical protein